MFRFNHHYQGAYYLSCCFSNSNFSKAQIARSLTMMMINPLNAELNTICHFLALLGVRHILHVSRMRVKPKHVGAFLI
jgi:hypothetical protein